MFVLCVPSACSCPGLCNCKALDSVHCIFCREELEGKAKGIDIFHEDWCVSALIDSKCKRLLAAAGAAVLGDVLGRR